MKTNKIILSIVILLFAFSANNMFCQKFYIKSGYNRSNYYSRGNSKLFNVNAQRIYFGVRTGLNLAYLEHSDSKINEEWSSYMSPLPMAGLFVEFNLGNVISVSPTIQYKADGTILKSNNYGTYHLTAHNLNLNMPIFINLPMSRFANPYVFITPEMEFNTFGGKIKLGEHKTTVTNASYNYFNYGLKFGAGCIIWYEIDESVCFVRIDCGYHFGLSNTMSKKEINGTANPINDINSYKINGTRYNRGIEICVSAGFPFIFK